MNVKPIELLLVEDSEPDVRLTMEALREARSVIGEYGRLGLPWRQALGALMLLSTIGGGEAEVRAAAESAREILARLGAKPFVERLDAALAHSPNPAGRSAALPAMAPGT